MLKKNDSKFVRDTAEVIWGRTTLKKRYLRKTKDNENETEEYSSKELTPKKYDLLKSM